MPTLRVTIVEACGLPKKSGMLDKTDPFVEVQVGAASGRTHSAKNAGESATWNQVFTLPYNHDPSMLVYVKDDDGSDKKHDFMASTQVSLPTVLSHGHWSGTLPLQPGSGYENKCQNPTVTLRMEVIH